MSIYTHKIQQIYLNGIMEQNNTWSLDRKLTCKAHSSNNFTFTAEDSVVLDNGFASIKPISWRAAIAQNVAPPEPLRQISMSIPVRDNNTMNEKTKNKLVTLGMLLMKIHQ